MCEHTAMKEANSNHVSINKEDPIILIRDNKGGVNSFILSKNLKRRPLKLKADDLLIKTSQVLERDKMEAFLKNQDSKVY